MVFHEIDSITSVLSGHRVIVYFVEGKHLTDNNDIRLRMILETLMEMLQKKNDDMLVVKVLHSSPQFEQFIDLYKPEITGILTLFVVNNEGIPVICEQVIDEDSIPNAIDSLSTICRLNPISRTEINKIKQLGTKASLFRSKSAKIETNSANEVLRKVDVDVSKCDPVSVKRTENRPADQVSSVSSLEPSISFSSDSGRQPGIIQPDYTNLQIRLSDGSRSVHQFQKDSKLQEVWAFISTKYKLKNFNLKTYDRSDYFSDVDYESTLSELGLCPNGVVIVVDKSIATYNNNGFLSMVQYGLQQALYKTTSFIMYIQGAMIMFWNRLFSNGPRPGNNGTSSRQLREDEGRSRDSSAVRERRPNKSTKKFGNIHTLRRSDDSDDENNRYNGNSTQQK